MALTQNEGKEFIGQGWAFPVRLEANGRIALVTGYEDIEQSIRIILGTIPGERVMRPNFGCRAWELVFAPNTVATHALLRHYVEQALGFWEPRIELVEVQVDNANQSTHPNIHGEALLVSIYYKIKATHDPRSIVYPFYLSAEN